MTTIKDVAKRANTSIATVSRVLNNKDGFSEEMRLKVLQAAEELGYESNAIARSLIKKKTDTIGVVFPNISSLITYEMLNGIEEVAHEHDYSVIVSYSYSNPERMLKALKTFKEKRVDGLLFASEILTDDYYEYIESMDIPTVLISTKSSKYQLPYVKVDDFDAAYAATNYLIERGHKEIGMLCGNPEDPIAGTPRLAGYKKALRDASLPVEDRKVIYGVDYSFEDGRKNLPLLLERFPEMTALFAASDEMAVGAIRAAHKRNMTLPDELSIVGYDNILISEMVTPPLTTVAQPLQEMGYTATEMLFDSIRHETKKGQQVILPFQIMERSSVVDVT